MSSGNTAIVAVIAIVVLVLLVFFLFIGSPPWFGNNGDLDVDVDVEPETPAEPVEPNPAPQGYFDRHGQQVYWRVPFEAISS